MGREGRVVTAAVVHVQEQAGVKHAGFCFCVVPVRAEDVQEVLRKGAVRERRDDVKRSVALLMLVGIVPVHRELRETGDEFEAGANIEYDPENPIVVNAVNDKTVSDTYWRWQISNTSDAGVVKIDHTVNKSGQNNKNSEDIYLNTVGLGTVKLWAGFSGNDLYNPAKEAITFTVVPKNVKSPIIELVDQSTIYYDGTAKEPAVKVYYAEGKEIPADQYDVTYDNNTNVSSTNSKAKIIVKSKTGALYTIDA